MNRSENIDQIGQALARAQSEILTAPRASANPFLGTYADLCSIWNAARGALSKNGLAVSQFPETVVADGAVVVSVTTMLMHQSGQWLAGDLRLSPSKTDPQGIGSCITYARRYGLAAICSVVVENEDDDANSASGQTGRAQQKDWKAKPTTAEKPAGAPATKLAALHQQALELVPLVLNICTLDKRLTPDAVIGSYFKNTKGKPLSYLEVKSFKTERQFQWAIKGIAALKESYRELLDRRPEHASQEPAGADVPF